MPGKSKINIIAIWLNTLLFLPSKAKVLQATSASSSGQASSNGLADAREILFSLLMSQLYILCQLANNHAIGSFTKLELQRTLNVLKEW
jgi:hypothetical protein